MHRWNKTLQRQGWGATGFTTIIVEGAAGASGATAGGSGAVSGSGRKRLTSASGFALSLGDGGEEMFPTEPGRSLTATAPRGGASPK